MIFNPPIPTKLISKNIFMSTGIFLVGKFSSFLITISLAKIFTPDIIGILGFANAISGILFMLIKFGLENYVLREVSLNQNKANNYFNKTFTLNILSTIIFLSLFVIITLLIVNNVLEQKILIGVFIATILGLIPEISIAYFKVFYKVVYEVYLRLILRSSQLFIILPIVIAYKNINLYIISIIAVAIIVLNLSLFLIKYKLKFKIRIVNVKQATKLIFESYPFVILSIVVFALVQTDIIMVKILTDNNSAGLYKIASIFYFPFALISATMMSIMLPVLSKNRNEPEIISGIINKIYRLFLMISLFIIYIIIFFSGPFIEMFFEGKYNGSIKVVGILIWTLIPYYLDMLNSYTLIAHGFENKVIKYNSQALVISIILNFSLIPFYGIVGAAIATLFAISFKWVNGIVYLNKIGMHIKLQLSVISLIVLSILNIYLIKIFINNFYFGFIFGLLLLSLLGYLFSIITRKDLANIKKLLFNKG